MIIFEDWSGGNQTLARSHTLLLDHTRLSACALLLGRVPMSIGRALSFLLNHLVKLFIVSKNSMTSTYGHSQLKTGHPVRSAIHKQLNGRLVLRWVTTWESLLLYVLHFFLHIIPFLCDLSDACAPASIVSSLELSKLRMEAMDTAVDRASL